MELYQALSFVADLAIILLLGIQSYVLVKLLPEIKRLSKSTEIFDMFKNPIDKVFKVDKKGGEVEVYPNNKEGI